MTMKTRVTSRVPKNKMEEFEKIAEIVGVSASNLFSKIVEHTNFDEIKGFELGYEKNIENEIAFRVSEKTKEKLSEMSKELDFLSSRRELIFAIVINTNQKFAFDKAKLIQEIQEIFERGLDGK